MVRRTVLAVLVIGALALLTISFRSPTSGALHDVQGAGASVLKPFQVAAERVARPFRDVYGYFSGLAHAKSENAKLKRELRDLRSTENQHVIAAQRLSELEKVVRFEQGPSFPKDFRSVTTTVISYPSAFTQEVTIAAGSSSGLRIGTPIMTADGLIGHVTNVTSNTAQVMLLTDPDSSVPARDISHGLVGQVHPGQGGTLILDRVAKALQPQKGDLVVTQGTVDSRYPDFYPYGLPIGEVQSVGTSDIASYLTVQLTPFAHFDSLDVVIALIPTKKR